MVDWNNSSGLFDDSHGLVAIFTHADTCPKTGQPRQRQSLAYSSDKGRTWHKYEGNPVLAEDDLIDFRDPKVFWHPQSERWVMVLVAGDHARFYGSKNLLEWTLTGEFGKGEGSHDGVWECPDLFELPVGDSGRSKWVLIISIGDNPSVPEDRERSILLASSTEIHSSMTNLRIGSCGWIMDETTMQGDLVGYT
ncbi:hypothetical protein HMSSN036_11950 [Paenibacillus macerans]|nr:hypothetical protein HMSSN036_11950 [Paenibacillus macerans]